MSEPTLDDIFPEASRHELPVKTVAVHIKNKINEEGFIDKIRKFLSTGKHVWRSSEMMSTHFNVDSVELDKFLSEQDEIASRANEERKVFYALKSRLEQKPEKPRPVITQDDLFALAQVSLAVDSLAQVLKRFGMVIHSKSSDAFSYLVDGRSKLEVGIMHFAAATKINLEKLE